MQVTPIKTRQLDPPQDDLISVIKESLLEIPENSILVITSKVVSIWQGRCVPMKDRTKDELVISESEKYIGREHVPHGHAIMTIKNNILAPSAGIDVSPRTGNYILLPKDPKVTAKQLHAILKEHYKTQNFGLIITDSHTKPLRRGMIGISIAHFGFLPLKDYRDVAELQSQPHPIIQGNVADSLAAAAVIVMGEGHERTPLALITDVPFVAFTELPPDLSKPYSSFEVPPDEDLYSPLLKNAPWKKGGSS